MKVSTKGRYAIRFLLDLAKNSQGKPVRIKDIAGRQDISDKYLEQVVSVLHKAGFVKSVRGPQGGYTLTREPEEYTIGEILRLTEGNMAPVACLADEENECERADKCSTLPLWKKLDAAIRDVIDTTTLADLIES
ncbi:MAG: Rrf2 family transcriptional regulator [Lachnospiraceae bacterium]|nr:Rrf2 family transcriptional regulator [Lachnospiraceae bacterium]